MHHHHNALAQGDDQPPPRRRRWTPQALHANEQHNLGLAAEAVCSFSAAPAPLSISHISLEGVKEEVKRWNGLDAYLSFSSHLHAHLLHPQHFTDVSPGRYTPYPAQRLCLAPGGPRPGTVRVAPLRQAPPPGQGG